MRIDIIEFAETPIRTRCIEMTPQQVARHLTMVNATADEIEIVKERKGNRNVWEIRIKTPPERPDRR